MNIAEAQLSSELQELYLENKETLSDILFLEDESRFFQKLFEKVILSTMVDEKFKEIELVNLRMAELQDRRDKLKIVLSSQQNSIECMLKDSNKKIEMSLVEQNMQIAAEIKSLLQSEKLVKKELYVLVEQVISDQKAGHLLKA